MFNSNNFGLVEGRLTRDVISLDNANGSKAVFVTVATTNIHRDVQYVNLRGYVSPKEASEGLGVYSSMHKGDLVKLHFNVATKSWEKDGVMNYDQYLFITKAELVAKKVKRKAVRNTSSEQKNKEMEVI